MSNIKIFKEKVKLNIRVIIVVIFCLAALAIIVGRLFYLQIIKHDYYNKQVANEVMTERVISAERGKIYDANGNALATNIITYSVCLSPHDIVEASKDTINNGTEVKAKRYTWTSQDGNITKTDLLANQLVAYELSDVLGADYNKIIENTTNEKNYYYLVMKNVSEELVDVLRTFVKENDFELLMYFQETSMRYYPYGSLSCHVIGFLNSESEGIYGVESYYNEYLKGTAGKYVYAKDAVNKEIPSKYETYVPAQDGYDITTTIDVFIQSELERVLKETADKSKATNRVTGIVMNPNTGAVYGMATYPNYDCNDPYTMSDYYSDVLSKYEDKDSDEYKAKYSECLFSMWNNKAISDTYEPGSTFKVVTTSMALEEEIVSLNDVFTCHGSLYIDGWDSPIACHNANGHGTVTFAVGLQQSCNPVLMTVALKIGTAKFYRYFEYFGYLEKTGIDLPAESSTISSSYDDFGNVSLAVYSFGQTFRTTAIQQLVAISCVANGGYLVTPHVLDKVTDSDGNTIYEYETSIKRQVISTETCNTIMNVLQEGVSGNGGAKNAYVKGYKVAAKTGTSEKKDKFDENGYTPWRVGSCVAVAPSDDAQVAVIIVVDEPQGSVYGSVVAAPYVSSLLSSILPYLGIEPQFSEDNINEYEIEVADYVGSSVNLVKNDLSYRGVNYVLVGDGNTIVAQSPAAGESIVKSSGKIYLYTNSVREEKVVVPDVTGYTNTDARQMLAILGINVTLEGATNSGNSTVIEQSVPSGMLVDKGSVIKLKLLHLDGTE